MYDRHVPVLILYHLASSLMLSMPLVPQSASGFMQQSKWASKVAAFINLESIGPGGVPIVFQHAGV